MASFLIVDFTPKDSDKLKRYGASVPETLAPFEGKVIARGEVHNLHGNEQHTHQVILSFPSSNDAKAWYQSPDYQALIELRNEGMDADFKLVG